jgi:signal transduction histidine kinase/CHASE3 domain sensor protein
MPKRPVPLSRQIVLAGGLALLVLAIAFAFFFVAIDRLRTASDQSQHAEEVITTATRMERLVIDLESGERGYVITHERTFLGPWRRASAELPGTSTRLQHLVADDPELESLAKRIDIGWRAFFRQWSLPLVQTAIRDPAAARKRVAAGGGKARIDTLRAQFSDLVGRERGVADSSRARAASAGTFAVWTGVATIAVIVAIVAAMVIYFARRAVVPMLRVADATVRVARGDHGVRVPEGGAGEVALLASSFNEMATTLELRRAELESVLDATADGLLMTDVDGNILFSNRAMNDLAVSLASTREGTIFDRIAALARRTGRAEEFGEVFAAVAADPEMVYDSEFTVLDVGRTFFGHTAPVRAAGGKLLGRIFTLREITAEREAERLKDEFVATVSHELRTPLTSIRGFVELLLAGEGGELEPDQRRFLTIVERNSERLLRLVGDLLLIAQLDAGTMRLEWSDVNVADVAAECVEASRPAAEEAGLKLDLQTDSYAPVAGDRARLAQLVDNLLSNAIKFTPRGGRVEVRAGADDGRVRLVVCDTGPGMAPEEVPHLFKRFYRTRSAGERQIQGTGLGLAISKAIAEAHGGSIVVETAPGEGTTFTVDLPRTSA